MRGHEPSVERKIRLWVVQQERNRLRERQRSRGDVRDEARTDVRAQEQRPPVDPRERERWQPE